MSKQLSWSEYTQLLNIARLANDVAIKRKLSKRMARYLLSLLKANATPRVKRIGKVFVGLSQVIPAGDRPAFQLVRCAVNRPNGWSNVKFVRPNK